MKKLIGSSLVAAVWLGASVLVSGPVIGETRTSESSVTQDAKAFKRTWYPFRGEVSAVDAEKQVLRFKKKGGERTVKLDGASTMTRDGQPMSLKDLKAGAYAHGKMRKNDAGEEVILAASIEDSAPAKNPDKKPRGKTAQTPSGNLDQASQ